MNCDNRGKSLQLYFVNGRPDGMLTAEMFNWTGHVLMFPRIQISAALNREEARRAGVYILFGEHEGKPLAYIGETGNISERTNYHDNKKVDWWDSAVVVTSANNRLNKDHVRYLEARLIQKAHQVGLVPLANNTNPSGPNLPEADQDSMEEFLKYLLMILPALRIDMFLDNRRPARCVVEPPDQENEVVVFELNVAGLRATAVLKGHEFVVQQDSQARAEWVGDPKYPSYAQRHADLVRSGVLSGVREDGHRVFTANYTFTSPSAAASVVLGRSEGGLTAWKVQGSDQTYRDWENDQPDDPPEDE